METVDHVLSALGGVTRASVALGVPIGTVSAWKTRQSIPARYWPKIVAEATARGVAGLSFEGLANMATRGGAP